MPTIVLEKCLPCIKLENGSHFAGQWGGDVLRLKIENCHIRKSLKKAKKKCKDSNLICVSEKCE